MATNVVQTRIKSKYDLLSAWNSSSFIPLMGEICVAVIPNSESNDYSVGNSPTNSGLTPYAIGIKVGDGSHTFAQLPWIQAVAGDIYAWAKAATKPTYAADEIQNLSTYISAQIQDTDTQYRIQAGTGDDAGKYFLQSKAKGANDSTFTTVSTIDLSSVQDALEFDGTYDSSTNKVATQSTVTNAINALDVSNISGFGAGKTLSALSETDGKISATFQDISITKSQISDAGTAAGSNVATSAIVDSDSSADLPTKAQVATYVAAKTAGLTGAMHFIGTATVAITDGSTTDPTISGYTFGTNGANAENGDVVLYGNKEFVWTGSAWEELGNEGSYALSSVTVTGSDGLTGGGALSSNQTITHAVPTGAAASTKGTSGGRTYIQTITTDKFGHITGTTTATETVTNTTYTFAEGSTNGAFSVTPSGGNAQSVSIHGLGDAAYANVASAIDNSSNANKLATAGQVAGVVSGLSGSATATAADGNQYSVLTGVTETNGVISKASEVKLAAIAKTGSIYDVIEHNTVTENSASITYLVFDCGDASHLITDPA